MEEGEGLMKVVEISLVRSSNFRCRMGRFGLEIAVSASKRSGTRIFRLSMPRRECDGFRCRTKGDMFEITSEHEALVSGVMDACCEVADWHRKPKSGTKNTKTFLCADCFPFEEQIKECLIGKEVAQKTAQADGSSMLVFGSVETVAELMHASRRDNEAVVKLMKRPVSQWEYGVRWPGRPLQRMSAADVKKAHA